MTTGRSFDDYVYDIDVGSVATTSSDSRTDGARFGQVLQVAGIEIPLLIGLAVVAIASILLNVALIVLLCCACRQLRAQRHNNNNSRSHSGFHKRRREGSSARSQVMGRGAHLATGNAMMSSSGRPVRSGNSR